MNPSHVTNITSLDGTPLPASSSVKYLGIRIRSDARQNDTVSIRIGKCMAAFNKMSAFWAHAHIPTDLKLRIYKAVFYPMLMYALHHSWLIKSQMRALDSWQAKTLRRVLRIKASMISHTTNAYILSLARTQPISSLIRAQRFKYYGHILRTSQDNAIRNICLTPACTQRRLTIKRKKGRPLDNWLRKVSQ